MSLVPSPFLKWAGGKRRLVPFIAEALGLSPPLPAMMAADGSVNAAAKAPALKRMIEPFAGSAAVSLALADRFDTIWLNDVNADLMNVYSMLQKDPGKYIRAACELFAPETNNAETYYRLRDKFNRTESSYERAVLFLYLNRHGYNGLCRYNNAGEFNVPFGRYKNPYFPEAELLAAAEVLAKARLTWVDFEEVMQDAGPGDVVYCDPPYVPLSSTASFTDYASCGFTLEDQRRLAIAAEAASRRGAVVAVSNHDTAWTRELYRGTEMHFTQVRRSISSNGQTRGRVREVLAIFWPDGVQGGLADGRRESSQSERAAADRLYLHDPDKTIRVMNQTEFVTWANNELPSLA